MRGKYFIRAKFKNKIKKSFFSDFFSFNFSLNIKTADALSFLTPHVSAYLTTVKFSEPAPPQGGSDCTVCVGSFDKICRGVSLFAFKNSLNLTTKKTPKKLKINRGYGDSFAVKRFNFFLNLQRKFNAQVICVKK